MTTKESFKHWLENEYTYGKGNKTLKSGSVTAYVSGIKSFSKKLKMNGNGILERQEVFAEVIVILSTI